MGKMKFWRKEAGKHNRDRTAKLREDYPLHPKVKGEGRKFKKVSEKAEGLPSDTMLKLFIHARLIESDLARDIVKFHKLDPVIPST